MLPDHHHLHWIGLPKILTLGVQPTGPEEHYLAEGQGAEMEIQHRRTKKRYRAEVAVHNAALVFKVLGQVR